jgi:hypothetical protein
MAENVQDLRKVGKVAAEVVVVGRRTRPATVIAIGASVAVTAIGARKNVAVTEGVVEAAVVKSPIVTMMITTVMMITTAMNTLRLLSPNEKSDGARF